MTDLSSLFAPLTTEKIDFANRIVMAPMARNYAPDFAPDEKMAAYYGRRAGGGVSLVITEASFIDHPVANGHKGTPAIFGEAALEGYRNVVDRVHAAGGKIFCQLWHMGGERPDQGIPNPDLPSVSPSGLIAPDVARGKALDLAEIREIQHSYARAAANAKAAGFDGVEIHGAHGYLIYAFMSPATNVRADAYGGPLENRLRFGVEVVERVRDAVGPAFPISFRTSQWTLRNYDARIYQTPSDLELAMLALTRAGVDIVHCSTRRFWEPAFEGSQLNLAGWAKKLSGKPTIAVGSIGLNSDFEKIDRRKEGASGLAAPEANLDALAERLSRGEFDLFAVGRALLANPDWPSQIRQGRMSELKPFTKDLLKILH